MWTPHWIIIPDEINNNNIINQIPHNLNFIFFLIKEFQ
jgi:hypothetical protein